MALIALLAIFLMQFSRRWLSPVASSILNDWIPVPLLLIPYWQVGQFFTGADPEAARRLADFDRAVFRTLGIKPRENSLGPAMSGYLELAYLLVYPVVPAGLGILYMAGLERFADYYWLVVLTATYTCFGITLFVRAMPPRTLSDYELFRMSPSKIGSMNHFILRRASIHAITFPSAHVGSAMATAFVLLRLEPWAGLIFLMIALSIAVATVTGGYHYAADVLLASLVALVVFAATFWTVKLG